MAEEDGNPQPSNSPIIEGTQKAVEIVGESPKQVHSYTMDKLSKAYAEPWHETAGQILIEDRQVRWHPVYQGVDEHARVARHWTPSSDAL